MKNQEVRNKKPLKKQRVRIGRLENAQDVAKYISRLIKKAHAGGGDMNGFYKLSIMASTLLKAIEVATFERRIAKLEKQIGERS